MTELTEAARRMLEVAHKHKVPLAYWKLDSFIAALNAMAEAAQPQWMPIETAPRDGTPVLIIRNVCSETDTGFSDDCNTYNTHVAEWWSGERNGAGAWVCYMDMIEDPHCPDPTHWMPLPKPPEPGEP